MQAMVPHADSEAGRNPVQEDRNREIPPVKRKQRGDGCEVKKTQSNACGPVQMLPVIYRIFDSDCVFDAHCFSAVCDALRLHTRSPSKPSRPVRFPDVRSISDEPRNPASATKTLQNSPQIRLSLHSWLLSWPVA